jgi:hypothetical protein
MGSHQPLSLQTASPAQWLARVIAPRVPAGRKDAAAGARGGGVILPAAGACHGALRLRPAIVALDLRSDNGAWDGGGLRRAFHAGDSGAQGAGGGAPLHGTRRSSRSRIRPVPVEIRLGCSNGKRKGRGGRGWRGGQASGAEGMGDATEED